MSRIPSPGKFAREKLYSVPDLRDRGWTATAIREFLPRDPDDERENPYYRHAAAPMKLWLRTRVHRVEKTKRFLAWRELAAGRRVAAIRGTATRVANMVEKMRQATITIKRGLSTEQIRELAAETHGGNFMGEPGPFHWSNRTARNCIRHNLTNYEEMWDLCNRGETGAEAYKVLRERVDELIDKTYPQFSGPDEDATEWPSTQLTPSPTPSQLPSLVIATSLLKGVDGVPHQTLQLLNRSSR